MREMRAILAAWIAIAALSADAARIALDLRPPATAKRGGVPRGAAAAADEGVVRRSRLPPGAATAPALEVGDELALALFDDAEVAVVLRERTESPLGGEAFLAGTPDGLLSAVVLQTDRGITVDAGGVGADGRVFSVVSSESGVDVVEYDPLAGESACAEADPEPRAPSAAEAALEADQPEGFVDVLVAFDRPAADWAREWGGGTTNFATVSVQKMNVALANSGLGATFRFRLVGTVEVDASGNGDLEAVLDRTQGGVGAWAAVKRARDEVGADVVSTLVDTGSAYGIVGIGFALLARNYDSFAGMPFNACSIRSVARRHTMTHECGHNLGAGHATAVNTASISPGPQLYGDSAGHFFAGTNGVAYHTVMAYNFDGFGGRYEEAPLFSSPSLEWAGAAAGDAKHDNADTLRRTWQKASTWRAQKVPTSWDVFFSPASGTILEDTLEVSLSPGRAGLPIRYTLDGTDPTSGSPLYEGPILLSEPTTIRAATVFEGRLGPVFQARYGPDEIAQALDAPHLRWTNSLDFPWIVQTEDAYAGGSAMCSGMLNASSSSLHTEISTVVEGPTRMSFRYKKDFTTDACFVVSAAPEGSPGAERPVFQDIQPGTSRREWTLAECEIPEGRHRVRFYFQQGGWHYVDAAGNYVFSGIWLDAVKFDALSRPPAIRPRSSPAEADALAFAGSLEVSIDPPEGREGVLWYSTDGSDPVAAGGIAVDDGDADTNACHGVVYSGPFTITRSTRVRAVFVEPGLEPSVPADARYLERHPIGPGEWTPDAAGAREAAAADPCARLVAVMLTASESDADGVAFAPVSRDPAFLDWCAANGVYLVVSDPEAYVESSAAGGWYWELFDAWDPAATVSSIPGFFFVRPSALGAPIAEGVAMADGDHAIGSVVYDGTVDALVAGFDSVLESILPAARRRTTRFDPNGGAVSPASRVYEAGKPYRALPVPTREGHRFEGWFTSPKEGAGSLVAAATVPPDAATTLYARWSPEPEGPVRPVYRFYSPSYRGHFFTIDQDERAALMCTNPNWDFEGVAYRALAEGVDGTATLYRFYSKGYRGHFFTIDEDEMRTVRNTNPNWRFEGAAFFVYPGEAEGTVPVHRFWSKRYRHHFYTVDEAEKTDLELHNPNWRYEGVAFYALPNEAVRNDGCGMANDESATRNDASAIGAAPAAAGGREWTLAAADGSPIAMRGVTEVGGILVETRGEAPDAADLESHAESADFVSRAESAELVSPAGEAGVRSGPEGRVRHSAFDIRPFRLSLPSGRWNASLWSASDGPLADEDAEGAFAFDLPASGVWHWLRIRAAADADSADAFSLWLRAE